MIGTRQTHRWIGTHDPQRLDVTPRDGLEHRHGLETLAFCHAWRAPEAANAADLLHRKSHMRGKLIGEPSGLASAHGIGLSGQGKWPRARNTYAPRGKVAI